MTNIRMNLFFNVLLLVFMTARVNAQPPAECKCHSKNNSMRRMHKIIGFSNCGNCHTKDENLMASRKQGKKSDEAINKFKKRIAEDKFCIPCHYKDGTVKKEIYKSSNMPKISDTYYCPKDKLRFSLGTEFCTKCSGKLLSINKMMEESRKNPSNEICRQCHTDEEAKNIEGHKTIADDKINKCLDCHHGHDDCASCHH